MKVHIDDYQIAEKLHEAPHKLLISLLGCFSIHELLDSEHRLLHLDISKKRSPGGQQKNKTQHCLSEDRQLELSFFQSESNDLNRLGYDPLRRPLLLFCHLSLLFLGDLFLVYLGLLRFPVHLVSLLLLLFLFFLHCHF
jgi:hypothetical protein